MKKLIRPRHLPALVAFAGLLGFLFRIWAMGKGPDIEGLYAPQPLAWALIWVLTAAVLAAVIWLPRKLRSPGRYADHFPPSITGAIGSVLASVACLTSAIGVLDGTLGGLTTPTAILGFGSVACFAFAAFARFTGKQPMILVHVVPFLYFALLTFDRCRNWSNQTQIGLFIFPFLASLCIMLATYQRACLDVDMGKRRSSLFWSLLAVYFCILSLPASKDMLFFGAMAVWLLTNLCSLRPLNRRKPQEPVEPAAEAEAPAAPMENIVAAPAQAENMSMDELMDWLNQDQ